MVQPHHHCLPQNRITQGHPSTFLPSQTNISTFYSQRILSIIATETLVISMQPYPSQPTPPKRHTSFDKGNLIRPMGASANLKLTYMSLSSHTSWSSIPCFTHYPLALQTLDIQNHMVWGTNSERTKPGACILSPRELNIPNDMPTLNQSTVISFHKRTP